MSVLIDELPPKTVRVTKEQIREVFAAARQPADYVIGMHRLVYGAEDWSRILKVTDFVKCSSELQVFAMSQAFEWDRRFAPDLQPGGTWMNYGFSALGMPELGWEVITAPAILRGGLR